MIRPMHNISYLLPEEIEDLSGKVIAFVYTKQGSKGVRNYLEILAYNEEKLYRYEGAFIDFKDTYLKIIPELKDLQNLVQDSKPIEDYKSYPLEYGAWLYVRNDHVRAFDKISNGKSASYLHKYWHVIACSTCIDYEKEVRYFFFEDMKDEIYHLAKEYVMQDKSFIDKINTFPFSECIEDSGDDEKVNTFIRSIINNGAKGRIFALLTLQHAYEMFYKEFIEVCGDPYWIKKYEEFEAIE